MQIENITNFKESINKIRSNTVNLNNNKQEELMDSSKFNKNIEQIEDALNKMYENIRIMESVIEYSKEYISTNIDSSIIDCKEYIADIEKYNDKAINEIKNYTLVNVKMECSDGPYVDRDGTIIKRCDTYNGGLYFNTIEKPLTVIKSVDIDFNTVNYSNNKDAIKSGDIYRTKYVLDRIESDGIKEDVELILSTPQTVNTVQLKLANCSCNSITYVKESGQEIITTNIHDNIPNGEKISGIKFSILSDNYISEEIEVERTSNTLEAKYTDPNASIEESDNEYEKRKFKESLEREVK